MTFEFESESHASPSTHEGLSTFGFGSPTKMDLQVANELFDKYSETGDPRVLGKINELKLNAMRDSAEAELSRLDGFKTRAEIEAQMAAEGASKAVANDRLSYVLVTYIKNVEGLDARRRAEVARVTDDAATQVATLKSDVRWPGLRLPTKRSASTANEPEWESSTGWIPVWKILETAIRESQASDTPATEIGKPTDVAKAPREEFLDAEGQKNLKFIRENRAEIDRLIAKLPAGEKNKAAKLLIGNPKTENVWILQSKVLDMKGTGPAWVDGRFWRRTLDALRTAVGEKKSETETVVAKAPEKATASQEADVGSKPKAPKEGGNANAEKQAAEAALKAQEQKEAAAKARMEWTALELQKNALKYLRPLGNDTYVVDTKLFEDGFAGLASFKFNPGTQEWSWLAFADPKAPESVNKWRPVSALEWHTSNGVTALQGFQFNQKTQDTVNAILTARSFSLQNGVALRSPSAQSKLVQGIPT